MANPQALKSLLIELRRVRSPLVRMKLVARAWRTLRELSPQERQEIASELGMRGVEGLLERLGNKSEGIPAAELLQALDKVEDDPVKLGALVRGLREPARRKELLRNGVGLLDRWLEDEARATEEETAEPAADTVEPVRHGTPEVAVASEIIVRPAPDHPAQAEIPPADSIEIEAPPARADPSTDEEPEQAPVVHTRVPPPVGTHTRERPADLSSLTRRFRALRESLGDSGRLRDLHAEDVADAFPDGWPRRRAVCLLLRAGLPGTTREAVSLVRRLSRPVDRRWCALALIASRELSAADAAVLREEFPFPAVGRRLRAS